MDSTLASLVTGWHPPCHERKHPKITKQNQYLLLNLLVLNEAVREALYCILPESLNLKFRFKEILDISNQNIEFNQTKEFHHDEERDYNHDQDFCPVC